ncbi:hypothetical protein AB6D15_10425, partial [Vibrio splendidus]
QVLSVTLFLSIGLGEHLPRSHPALWAELVQSLKLVGFHKLIKGNYLYYFGRLKVLPTSSEQQ